jgi:hypothetical protein
LPDARRGIAPGRIDLTGLPARETMPGQHVGHALTVGGVGARHRNQILHGHMRGELTVADALLNGFGNLLHQRQPARHPTDAAVKAACQLVEAVAETLFEFRQQPTLFQCRLAFRKTQRAFQHQRIGFANVPDDGFDSVAAQLLYCGNPLVAIDNSISVG